jgi:hypothetical protein
MPPGPALPPDASSRSKARCAPCHAPASSAVRPAVRSSTGWEEGCSIHASARFSPTSARRSTVGGADGGWLAWDSAAFRGEEGVAKGCCSAPGGSSKASLILRSTARTSRPGGGSNATAVVSGFSRMLRPTSKAAPWRSARGRRSPFFPLRRGTLPDRRTGPRDRHRRACTSRASGTAPRATRGRRPA